MKICVDFGHPKNVHTLKHVLSGLRQRGHEFLILARDKECVQPLCKILNIPFFDRGRGGNGIMGRIAYMAKTVFRLHSLISNFRPDLFISFGSPILAIMGFLKKKPVIVFDDHEPNRIIQALYVPTSKAIVVPSCFQKTLSYKQVSFDGYFELAYLHPCRFKPAADILASLKLAASQPYVLLRFVAWKALHDRSFHGMDDETKRRLVAAFSCNAKVFISAEGKLPPDLEPYRLSLTAERMHDVLAGAALFVGDSATMAAEAAVLGVPTLHLSDLKTGYLLELQNKYCLLKSFPLSPAGIEQMITNGIQWLVDACIRSEWQTKRQCMLVDKIDVTAFMTWFIDRFPDSVKIMIADPQYSKRFKL
jgi:predicted glycosyltransferase